MSEPIRPLTPAADPGFPEGMQTPRGRRQPIIQPNFPENCMKIKKIGPIGGGSKLLLCRSATGNQCLQENVSIEI